MAEKCRAETDRVLKHKLHLKPNITKEEAKDLKELRQDKNSIMFTGDKRWLW